MRFRLTKQDIQEAMKLHRGRRALFFHVLVPVIMGVILGLENKKNEHVVTTYLIFIFIYFIVAVLASRWQKRRDIMQFEENEELSADCEASIVNDELVLVSDKSTTTLPRQRIKRVVKNSSVVLLYRSRILFHVLPMAAVSRDADVSRWLGLDGSAQQGNAPTASQG